MGMPLREISFEEHVEELSLKLEAELLTTGRVDSFLAEMDSVIWDKISDEMGEGGEMQSVCHFLKFDPVEAQGRFISLYKKAIRERVIEDEVNGTNKITDYFRE